MASFVVAARFLLLTLTVLGFAGRRILCVFFLAAIAISATAVLGARLTFEEAGAGADREIL
eukprot:scaffold9113_cov129-Skeletonema_marinoi.AAC.3